MTQLKKMLCVFSILLFFMCTIPAVTLAADINVTVSGVTLTVNANGEISDGTTTYILAATDKITSTGDLSIVLNNTSPLEIKSIAAAGDLTISGTGTLLVVNSDVNGIGVNVTNGGDLTVIGGKLIVTADGSSSGGAIFVEGGGDITVRGSGALLKGNGNFFGIRMPSNNAGIILVEEGGTLEGSGSSIGVNTPLGMTVISGGKLHGDGGYHGIQSGAIIVSGEGSRVSGEGTEWGIQSTVTITVSQKGEVYGEATVVGVNSVCAGVRVSGRDANYVGITVESGGKLIGKGGYCAVTATHGINVTGEGSTLEGETSGNAGVFATNDNTGGGALSKISVSNGGSITGKGALTAGIYSYYGNIEAGVGGTLTGISPVYGVYNRMANIVADGGTIKGAADSYLTGTGDPAAAVYGYSAYGGGTAIISAINGGTIWEDYSSGITLALDDTTAVDPYDGLNIVDIANYEWNPYLKVSGTGLLAQYKYDTTQTITGTRTKNVAGEIVGLSTSGIHKITFLGTLDAPDYFSDTPSTPSDTPAKTGDNSRPLLWVTIGMLPLLLVVACLLLGKKRQKEFFRLTVRAS